MKAIEYLFESLEILKDLEKLNKLGDYGWEIAYVDKDVVNHVIFKRVYDISEFNGPSWLR